MKKAEIKIGKWYYCKVSGRLARVQILSESVYGRGWNGRNVETGREVHVRSAARLRGEVKPFAARSRQA